MESPFGLSRHSHELSPNSGRTYQEGKCNGPEMFFSERGNGLWMVKGDRSTLPAIHDTDEGQNLTLRGQLLLADFSIDFYTAGEASDAFLARFGNLVGALTSGRQAASGVRGSS